MLQQLGKKGAAKAAKDMGSPLFDTFEATQTQELASMKNALATHYTESIDAFKSSFYQKLAGLSEGEDEARKRLYETFVFELTKLSEDLPKEIQEKSNFIAQKHQTELEKLKASVKEGDKKTIPRIDSRKKEIEERYVREFSLLQTSITKTIESLMEKAGSEVFREEKKEKGEKESSIIFEINEMDEGTLLYHLHSQRPEIYKDYERKHLSKPEALHYAKIFLAKEKGLSDVVIKKFFGSLEGEQ
jgi:phage-related tail protein